MAALEAEFKRIGSAFVEPYRQNLIMGVTAYALRRLALDSPTARAAVETFISSHDPDESKRRSEVVERTIAKHKNGKLVAWHEYYERARIKALYRLGATNEVLEQLEQARQLLSSYSWKGRGAGSDRSVYAALLDVAAAHGVLHKDGVAVSISVQNLAVNARVGDRPGMLHSSGWLRWSWCGATLLAGESRRTLGLSSY